MLDQSGQEAGEAAAAGRWIDLGMGIEARNEEPDAFIGRGESRYVRRTSTKYWEPQLALVSCCLVIGLDAQLLIGRTGARLPAR